MNMGSMARYADLKQQEADLKAQLANITPEIESLRDIVLQEFAENGVSNMRVNGLTLYIHSQLWAGAVQEEVPGKPGATRGNAERTCQALIEAGLGDFVHPGFNAQTLSAWAREQPLDEDGNVVLPEALVGNISIARKTDVRIRGIQKNREQDNDGN